METGEEEEHGRMCGDGEAADESRRLSVSRSRASLCGGAYHVSLGVDVQVEKSNPHPAIK